jgi:hypothetical protein
MQHPLKITVSALVFGIGILSGVTSSGCASRATEVMEAPTMAARYTNYSTSEEKTDVDMPDLAKARFLDALDADLQREGGFAEGGGLIISYRFLKYDAGNAFGR